MCFRIFLFFFLKISANIVNIPDSMIVKQSWAEKESGFWNSWKPRWIVLRKATLNQSALLYVYKEERKYINPTVTIELNRNNCVIQNVCKKVKYVFKIEYSIIF